MPAAVIQDFCQVVMLRPTTEVSSKLDYDGLSDTVARSSISSLVGMALPCMMYAAAMLGRYFLLANVTNKPESS